MDGNSGDVCFWFRWGGAISLFSSVGNRGYTSRVHQQFGGSEKRERASGAPVVRN